MKVVLLNMEHWDQGRRPSGRGCARVGGVELGGTSGNLWEKEARGHGEGLRKRD